MSIDLVRMDTALRSAGVMFTGLVAGNPPGSFGVLSKDGQQLGVWDVPPADQALATSTAAAVDVQPHKPRAMWQIRADIQALTVAQFTNVWNDLSAPVSGGPPRKYLQDYGTNASAIFVMDHVLFVQGGTQAQLKAGQISLAAMYTQDNPDYLWHPPFDPSIAVHGDEPILT